MTRTCSFPHCLPRAGRSSQEAGAGAVAAPFAGALGAADAFAGGEAAARARAGMLGAVEMRPLLKMPSPPLPPPQLSLAWLKPRTTWQSLESGAFAGGDPHAPTAPVPAAAPAPAAQASSLSDAEAEADVAAKTSLNSLSEASRTALHLVDDGERNEAGSERERDRESEATLEEELQLRGLGLPPSLTSLSSSRDKSARSSAQRASVRVALDELARALPPPLPPPVLLEHGHRRPRYVPTPTPASASGRSRAHAMESVGAERGAPGLRLSELSLGVDPCDPDACAALRKAAHDLQLCSLALTPSSSAASSSLGSRAASASARPRSRHARTHARRPRPDWPSCRLSLQGRPAGEVSGAQRALFELVSGMTESLSCSSSAGGPGAAAAAGGDAPPSAPRHAPSPFVFECASPPPPPPSGLRAPPPPSAQMHYASMERSPVACVGYGGGQRCMAPFHKGHRDLDSSSAGSDADAGARVVDWRVLRQPRSQLPRGRSPPRRAGTTAAKGQRGSRRRGRKSPRRRRRRRRRAGDRTRSTAAAPRRRRRRGRGGKRRGNKAKPGLGLGLGLLAEARGDSDAEEVSLAGAGAGRSNVYAEQLARMAAEDSARHAGPIAAAARVAMHKRKTRRGSPVRASARARGRAVGAAGGGRQLSPRRPVATPGPGGAPRARLTRSPDGRRVLSLQLGPAVRCPPGSPGSARARSAPRSAQRGATPRRTTRRVDAGELSASSTVNTLVALPAASSLYCCTPLCGSPPATPTLMHPSRLEVSAYANALASGGGVGGGGGDGAAVRTAVEGAGAPPAEGAAPAAPEDSSLAFWLRLICGPRKDGRAMGSLLRSQQVFAECARLLSCNPPLPPARLPPRRSPDADEEEECDVRCWQRPRVRLGRRRRLLRPRLPSAPALPGAMGPLHGGCRAAAFRVHRQRPHAARGALRRALQVMSVAFAPAPAPSERPATPDPTPACPPAEWPLFAAPALAPSPDSSTLSASDDKLCGSRWAALAAAKNIWARADGGSGSSSGLTPPASTAQAAAPTPAPGPQPPTAAAPDTTPAPMDSALPKLPVYVLPHAASKIKLDRPSAPGSPAVQRFGLPVARPPPYASAATATSAAPAPRPGGPLPRDGEW